MEAAAGTIDAAIAAAQAGDLAKAKDEFEEYDEAWEKIEDGIKDASADAYKAIEDDMDEVEIALVKPAQPDKAASLSALQKLRSTIHTQRAKLR